MTLNDIIEFFKTVEGAITGLIALGTSISGFLWGGYKWIMKPIKRINQVLHNNSVLLGTNSEKLNKALHTIETRVEPFMESIQKEFSTNSGKTIKDQLFRIENAQSLNEMRVKALSMNIDNLGIYECDTTGRCIWVNDTYAEIWGRDKQELMGAGWLLGLSEDERQEIWEKWQYSVNHGTPYEAEYTITNKKNGKKIPVKTSAICYKGADGKPAIYIGTIREKKKLTP